MKLLEILSVDFDANQLLITYTESVKYRRKIWIQCISYLQTSRQFMIQSGESLVQYSHQVWYPYGTSKANETCSTVWTGKHFHDTFPIKNGLKKQMLYHH